MKVSESYLNDFIDHMLTLKDEDGAWNRGYRVALERVKEIIETNMKIEEKHENTGT
jgi:hypothetical protein